MAVVPITNRPIILLVILVFCTQIFWLGERDFGSRGEDRELLAAQSVLDGNWLLPRGYGGVVASKPPLLHWCVASLAFLTGEISGVAARLPSALASFIFLVLFYYFLERRSGRRTAMLSVLLLFASFEWFRFGIQCRVDMLHAVFLAGSLCALFSWQERSLQGFPLMAVFLMLGAVLSKGPVGLILPLLVFAAYLLLQGEKRNQVLSAVLKVFIPALLLSSLWYLAAFIKGGDEFRAKVASENITRFLSSMEDQPHEHSIFYLVGTLLLGLLPWILVLIPGYFQKHIWPVLRSLYLSFRSTPKSFRWLRLHLRLRRKLVLLWLHFVRWFSSKGAFERFAWLSAVCIFVFYCIPAGKRSVYLLPAYPFIVFLLADSILSFGILQRRLAERSFKWLCGVVVLLYSLLLCFIFGKTAWFESFLGARISSHSSFLQEQLLFVFSSSYLRIFLLFFPGFLAFFYMLPLLAVKRASFLGGILGLTFSLYLAFGGALAGQYSNALSPKELAECIAPIVKDQELYSYGSEFYGLSFYLQKIMATRNAGFEKGMLLVVYEDDLGDLQKLLETGLSTRVLLRSAGYIGEPLKHVLIVEITET